MYFLLDRIGIAGTGEDLVMALLILIASYVTGKILSFILGKAGHYFAERARSELGDQLIQIFKTPLFHLSLLVGAYLAAEQLGLPDRLFSTIQGVIYALGVFLGAYILKRIFDTLLGRHAGQVAKRTGSRLYAEFSPLVDKVVTFFIFGIALIIVLSHFGYSVTSLVAALGVGSLAIALASKETLGNMIAGFIIMTDRPFLPGDRIELATKEEGDVLEIGLRSTRMRTLEGSLMVIPNSQLVDNRVINRSYPEDKMACQIKVQVPFAQDRDRAGSILEGIPREVPGVLADPAPRAFVQELNSQSCEFVLSFWVTDVRRSKEIMDRIYRRIGEQFLRESIWADK